jgi:hypothetical protein
MWDTAAGVGFSWHGEITLRVEDGEGQRILNK